MYQITIPGGFYEVESYSQAKLAAEKDVARYGADHVAISFKSGFTGAWIVQKFNEVGKYWTAVQINVQSKEV